MVLKKAGYDYLNTTVYSSGDYPIGLRCDIKNDNFVIVAVTPDSDAEKAGLKVKDVILAIDGTTIHDKNSMGSTIKQNLANKRCVTMQIERSASVSRQTYK